MSSEVDVLIIGAGPAGLTLANWFRSCDAKVCLIDQKPGLNQRGHAEGLKSTTIEIFESFGIGPQIWAESWRVEEIAIWGPGAGDGIGNVSGGIVREQIIQDKVEELGKTREVTLEQARVENHMFHNLRSSSNIDFIWNSRPTKLDVKHERLEDHSLHPFRVVIGKSMQNGGSNMNGSMLHDDLNTQIIHARYLVGADGAHSWTRKQLDIKLEGDLTDAVFGVVDIVPKTNFPDIRKCCYLKAHNGVILIVPRPGKEIRLYVPVETGKVLSDPHNLSLDRIMDAARKIIAPYQLDFISCSWWSAYRVGQRVAEHFSLWDRAFLMGDAVHTHSPKAGQGMNTSIQDAYNLGWKLRLSLHGFVSSKILSTYQSERRPLAQDLIAFDRGHLKLFSAPGVAFDSNLVSSLKFTTGLSIRYPESSIVQLPRKNGVTQHLGPSLLKADVVPGKRLPDFQVVYQADGITTRIHPRLCSSGAFRMLLFAGDISKPELLERVLSIGSWLGEQPTGLGKLTCGGDKARVEVLLIHCAPREAVELLSLPEVFRPMSEEWGIDYWRVFADVESAHEGHGRAYERLEIDRNEGCCLIVRPDGYIGAVTRVTAREDILRYFTGIEVISAIEGMNGSKRL